MNNQFFANGKIDWKKVKLAEITNTKWMKGRAKGIPQANEPLHENNQKKEVQDIP